MNNQELHLMEGNLAVDDRGVVGFVNDFMFSDVKRFYIVQNHAAGFVRAWHAHRREGKYVLVIDGAAIVAAVKILDWENPSPHSHIERYILTALKPAVLYIPPGYGNGFKSLTSDTKIIFFSTSSLEESREDDIRWPASFFGDIWTILER